MLRRKSVLRCRAGVYSQTREAYDFAQRVRGASFMPQFWKGDAGKTFRVRYAASDNGFEESDLVFVNERPFAVLEWADTGAAMVSVELDAQKLRVADAGGSLYHYAGPVIDPR
jgi:hypothetical protein